MSKKRRTHQESEGLEESVRYRPSRIIVDSDKYIKDLIRELAAVLIERGRDSFVIDEPTDYFAEITMSGKATLGQTWLRNSLEFEINLALFGVDET